MSDLRFLGHDLIFVSTKPAAAHLSLMELGLSRMSAVALYEKIARDDLDKDQCLAWVADRVDQFVGMDIPAIILREILERLHPDAKGQPDQVSLI